MTKLTKAQSKRFDKEFPELKSNLEHYEKINRKLKQHLASELATQKKEIYAKGYTEGLLMNKKKHEPGIKRKIIEKLEKMKVPVSQADKALAKGFTKSGIYRIFKNKTLDQAIKSIK